jgi:hypothetical protein
MEVRFRTTVTVRVPYADFRRFGAAVQRFAPIEHAWGQARFSYASPISNHARPISTVRVLVDSLGERGEDEGAKDAASETAIRALIFVRATDLNAEVTLEVIE